MKKVFAFAVLSLCFVALSQVGWAQGTPEAARESFPVQLALFDPIQLKPSSADISLFRLNLLYGYNKKVSGLDIGIVSRADEMQGMQIGVINWADTFTGVQFGIWNSVRRIRGLQIGLGNVIHQDRRALPLMSFGWYI